MAWCNKGMATLLPRSEIFLKTKLISFGKDSGRAFLQILQKDDLNTVRMRIAFPTELTTTPKTWRPRTPVAFRDAFLMSFLKLKDCIEHFSATNVTNNTRVDTPHAASNKDVKLLSDFVWTDGDPLATTRYRFLCGISFNIELSANFVLKQMFGRGQCMKDICKLILALDNCNSSDKTTHKKVCKSNLKQPYQ